MEYIAKSGNPEKQRSLCALVAVFEGKKLSPTAQIIDTASQGMISNLCKRGDFKGELGQTLTLFKLPGIQAERVLLVGCGKEKDLNTHTWKKALIAAAKALQTSSLTEASSYLQEITVKGADTLQKAKQLVETFEHTFYNFDLYKAKKSTLKLKRVQLCYKSRKDMSAADQGIQQGRAIAAGVTTCRQLGNMPGNVCNPTYLANEAKNLAKRLPLKITVLEEKDLLKLQMGAFMAVSQGSEQPAKLIVIEYRNAHDEPPICLVGKGITFDTGGINLKPSTHINGMKYDMCGAASVLGTLEAVATMRLKVNVVGLIAAAENMPSGRATRPDDIVTTMSGQTVEIGNTDAEGRLVLCDTLTYAAKFKPKTVIDIATLTGACVVALGTHATGLMSNQPALTKNLLDAGKKSGDRAWELPLWEEYDRQIDSKVADISNVGIGSAGTITAGCFLSRFTKDYAWAHLDIAGTATGWGKEGMATGRPVPMLVQYILEQCA